MSRARIIVSCRAPASAAVHLPVHLFLRRRHRTRFTSDIDLLHYLSYLTFCLKLVEAPYMLSCIPSDIWHITKLSALCWYIRLRILSQESSIYSFLIWRIPKQSAKERQDHAQSRTDALRLQKLALLTNLPRRNNAPTLTV